MGPDRSAAITGQVLILYSALTCASTPVALRYLYLQPHPPASPVLAAAQTGFAAVIMRGVGAGVRRALSRAEPAVQPFLRLGARIGRPLARALNSRAKNLRWAGAELGLLAFLANSVMIYGFMFTTIAKGAFLIRASIIFTPLLCTVAGEAVPAGLWAGSLLGFAGSVMISLDPSHTSSGAPGASAAAGPFGFQPEVWGDLVLLMSACLWSIVMVMTMAVLSLGWLGAAAVSEVQQGEPIVTLWEGYRDPIAWLVLLWPAVGQYSTGEAAQVAGQARISASAGQVILAMDPVISILLGLLVNREETQMGPLGWVGGATLMGACILASFYARSED
ncbi:hypothetical protein COCSUDRAFT_39263 [Coccomyxa subellipsoidea C-169]|uniref:EamA domain-containing protein n=1 Tax=Coccomyxa subellipsoidea (strain C-169) TaxID=574566 RepID=I0ZAJ0_COCSC|nr:hypothetical protein COCSUDRAFT_39263 [Coccomyxa subellipsoidea C-169]EIE27659.1 hypothetical protein COCSUDRAFT_39263 [Coccomyxa subellipsoidea C-169]|eukprot:XP_005652203.1 hypothetical protein COCSUDRAFT_39263 [Coccomyxa subellipsoidea C-169]